MSKILKDLLYAESHEWVKKLSDDEVLVGISDYAAKQLGSIVFVDLPEEGDSVVAKTEFGAVESVKAASDLISPVTGEVIAINEELVGNPELVNEDPYAAWLIKVRLEKPEELEDLLNADKYEAIL